MTEPLDTTGMMLGEMKGQLREVIHTMNNMSSKLDSLTERVVGAAGLPAKVKELEDRIAVLEADRHKRDGAMSFGNWLMKSPMAAWIAAAAFAAWQIFKGKL